LPRSPLRAAWRYGCSRPPRRSTTLVAQREFWLEFCWLDQEYRDAVRRLARFCLEHTEGLQAAAAAPLGLRSE